MIRTYSGVRRQMSPETYFQGMSALRCPYCKSHFLRKQETQLMTNYWAKCLRCLSSVDTDSTELSILPTYSQFIHKKSVFDRVWYHATDVEEWEQGLKDSSDLMFVPGSGHVDRPETRRYFAHVGSQETAVRRSMDLGGLKYMYKVMMIPGQEVSRRIFADINWWPTVLNESAEFDQFTEINRYVNRYEIPGSISLLVAYGSFKVVDRYELTKKVKSST